MHRLCRMIHQPASLAFAEAGSVTAGYEGDAQTVGRYPNALLEESVKSPILFPREINRGARPRLDDGGEHGAQIGRERDGKISPWVVRVALGIRKRKVVLFKVDVMNRDGGFVESATSPKHCLKNRFHPRRFILDGRSDSLNVAVGERRFTFLKFHWDDESIEGIRLDELAANCLGQDKAKKLQLHAGRVVLCCPVVNDSSDAPAQIFGSVEVFYLPRKIKSFVRQKLSDGAPSNFGSAKRLRAFESVSGRQVTKNPRLEIVAAMVAPIRLLLKSLFVRQPFCFARVGRIIPAKASRFFPPFPVVRACAEIPIRRARVFSEMGHDVHSLTYSHVFQCVLKWLNDELPSANTVWLCGHKPTITQRGFLKPGVTDCYATAVSHVSHFGLIYKGKPAHPLVNLSERIA